MPRETGRREVLHPLGGTRLQGAPPPPHVVAKLVGRANKMARPPDSSAPLVHYAAVVGDIKAASKAGKTPLKDPLKEIEERRAG